MLLFWVNLSQGHKRIYSKNKITCEHLAQTIIIYKKYKTNMHTKVKYYKESTHQVAEQEN